MNAIYLNQSKKCSPSEVCRRVEHGFLFFRGHIFNRPEHYNTDLDYVAAVLRNGGLGFLMTKSRGWDGSWAIVLKVDDGPAFGDGVTYCFTDHLGQETLYYDDQGNISTCILPLARKTIIDPVYRSAVMKWGYCPGERTPWKGIHRILPGMIYKFGGMWLPEAHEPLDFPYSDREEPGVFGPTVPECYRAVYKAVEERLNYFSGMKPALLLSGGLDSSILASVFCSLGVDASYYTVANGEDEKYVNLLSNYLDIPVTRLNLVPVDHEDLVEILASNETPVDLGSLLPQYQILSQVPESLVFTGDGADELFGGYRRAKEYDSQASDIFHELTFYHLPRLARTADYYDKTLVCPYLAREVVDIALRLPWENCRTEKEFLKEAFKGEIPEEIITRKKQPLKSSDLLADPLKWRKHLDNIFYNF